MSLGSKEFEFGRGEELAHTITHGAGLLLSLAGTPILITLAALHGDAWHVVSCAVFGSTLILLYTTSTFYHGLSSPRSKLIFCKLDYSAIYLLIAGTYTPFALVSLRGPLGWTLFGLVWSLAVLGVLFELLMRRRRGWLSLSFYLATSWMLVVALRPLVATVAPGGLWLLASGGFAYTAGTIFYAWRGFRYHHAVWHIFVLAGSVLHYLSVLLYVIPIYGR